MTGTDHSTLRVNVMNLGKPHAKDFKINQYWVPESGKLITLGKVLNLSQIAALAIYLDILYEYYEEEEFEELEEGEEEHTDEVSDHPRLWGDRILNKSAFRYANYLFKKDFLIFKVTTDNAFGYRHSFIQLKYEYLKLKK